MPANRLWVGQCQIMALKHSRAPLEDVLKRLIQIFVSEKQNKQGFDEREQTPRNCLVFCISSLFILFLAVFENNTTFFSWLGEINAENLTWGSRVTLYLGKGPKAWQGMNQGDRGRTCLGTWRWRGVKWLVLCWCRQKERSEHQQSTVSSLGQMASERFELGELENSDSVLERKIWQAADLAFI